jgi:DNA-binding MarR family transcriptional regulator
MDTYGRLAQELTLLLRVMKGLHARVVEESDLPFEVAGSFVLGRLAVLGPVRLTQLAQELGLDPSSVSRQVSSLERHGLVTKEKDESDLRAQRLVLTEQGHAAVVALREGRARELERLLPGWSERELDDLTTALSRLHHDLAHHDLAARRDRQEQPA